MSVLLGIALVAIGIGGLLELLRARRRQGLRGLLSHEMFGVLRVIGQRTVVREALRGDVSALEAARALEQLGIAAGAWVELPEVRRAYMIHALRLLDAFEHAGPSVVAEPDTIARMLALGWVDYQVNESIGTCVAITDEGRTQLRRANGLVLPTEAA